MLPDTLNAAKEIQALSWASAHHIANFHLLEEALDFNTSLQYAHY